jgi:tetratricopeptide (TPR) repeat protein
MINFDDIFEGALVPIWLREFGENPNNAVEDILTGRADLELLSVADPVGVLLDWLERIPGQTGFAEALDNALAEWISRSWGNPALETAASSATLTSVAWSRAGSLIELHTTLRESAKALRSHVMADRRFLNSITQGRSRDPQGQAWLAVAQYQDDRSLVDEWWRLCYLPPDEPWYRGVYGILALRRLPPADDITGGGLPEEVAEGLSVLGQALNRRVKEGWLDEVVAKKDYQRILRMTMAAYPPLDEWRAFWRSALGRRPQVPDEWIEEVIDLAARGTRPKALGRAARREPNLQWSILAGKIAAKLTSHDTEAIARAQRLLDEQSEYANATGDVQFVVRSACNFASRVMERMPDRACAWADLARHFDPWNAYAWTVSAQALLHSNRLVDALRLGIEAIERFPDNVVARTGLAETLRAQDRLEEAEAVYRDTIQRFPDNVIAQTAYESLVRQIANRDKETVRPHTTEQTTTPEPESTTSDVVIEDNGPTLDVSLNEDNAVSPPSSPTQLRRDDVETLLTDAYLIRKIGRVLGEMRGRQAVDDRIRRALEGLVMQERSSSRAASQAGILYMIDGKLDEAVAILREATKRFPGSARVKYALARAERELARRENSLLYAAERDVTTPLRELGRLDEHYRPIQLLGESRGYLILRDGATVKGKAINALGRLARWISERPDPAIMGGMKDSTAEESDELTFIQWWSEQVYDRVFGAQSVKLAADISDLDTIARQVLENENALNELEEDFVFKYAAV